MENHKHTACTRNCATVYHIHIYDKEMQNKRQTPNTTTPRIPKQTLTYKYVYVGQVHIVLYTYIGSYVCGCSYIPSYTYARKTKEIKIIFLFRYKSAHSQLKILHTTRCLVSHIFINRGYKHHTRATTDTMYHQPKPPPSYNTSRKPIYLIAQYTQHYGIPYSHINSVSSMKTIKRDAGNVPLTFYLYLRMYMYMQVCRFVFV